MYISLKPPKLSAPVPSSPCLKMKQESKIGGKLCQSISLQLVGLRSQMSLNVVGSQHIDAQH